ncbi:MAG: GH92 family glycosyl hydrolase [Bacteroidales bacterium]|nr:GH92 family glycosyl hydrolase [Bacteroidales bacterium]
MKKLIILGFICLLTACSHEKPEMVSDPVEYVSTLTGTLSHHAFSTGNTYPAIALPWGMNFWTPVTGKMGDGWAYRYDQNIIRGLKQTHQPSPWINDYGQFAIMPVRDAAYVDENSRASWFSHKSETAKPYYYQVYLADHDINAEVSPTERAAAFVFTYPESETSGVVIDAFDKGSYIKVIPEMNAVVGYTTKNSGGVPDNFRNWFVLKFDKDIENWTLYDGADNPSPLADELEGNRIIASVCFKTVRGEKVGMKAASSFISFEQAWRNFEEVEKLTFEQVKEAAKERWNEVLGRIEVGGGTTDQHRTFYSCLYRSLLFPRKFYEIDAEGKPLHYSPYNGQICDGYLYTDTGFWDTFRALFPLLNLVYPSVNQEIQQGLANISRENEFLPEWASPGHRGCMVGNNSASVVADAILKGITPEEDWQTLYDCIVYGTEHVHPEISSTGRLGHEYYNTIGYIPYNVGIHESVARTLEYAYNDWCILQLARKLGRPDDEIARWEARSNNWKNVFDPSHNLMRGRNADGSFQEPFSPYKWGGAFTEGNAWHYTWSVFHDVEGLMEAMGGRKEFTAMLDSVFVVPPVYDDSYYGYRIHEITEMQVADMGNYAHGNQPAQHMIYLYDWAGEPRKAQKRIREVMDRLYSSAPDGYCGDEDNGQTSAWYVFSAMGFYPVCPASDRYAIGRPYFPRMKVHLENGNVLNINASAAGGTDDSMGTYIKDIALGGRKWKENFLRHEDIVKGNTLEFTMED